MEKPRPKTTEGVPWADHNETESIPLDPSPEEYIDDSDSGLAADERVASPPGRGTERETYEDRAEREQD
jgi:hypothetical protein